MEHLREQDRLSHLAHPPDKGSSGTIAYYPRIIFASSQFNSNHQDYQLFTFTFKMMSSLSVQWDQDHTVQLVSDLWINRPWYMDNTPISELDFELSLPSFDV